MKITQFFNDVLGARLANAVWSWGATDPKTNRVFLRIWKDDITTDGARVLVGRDKPRRNSNGFAERHKHLAEIRNGAVAFGVVCKAVDEETDDVRQIESFDTTALLKLGQLTNENGLIYARIEARVPVTEVMGQPPTQDTQPAMNYFFYNTDNTDETLKDVEGRFRILIQKNFAATSGPPEFGEKLGMLTKGDTLLMYENKVGVVAIGTVLEKWDGQSHSPPEYYLGRFGWEYRIAVDWFLDLSEKPISLQELRQRIGYTPSGTLWKDDKHGAEFEAMIKERRPSPSSLPADVADQTESDSASFIPQEGDQRQIVERQIKERRGQQAFRNALRERYENQCVVTGCEVLDVLEAAHIKPYQGENDNHPENGLLLRADIHTLFDLDLLGIEPEQLRVELHPSLMKEYGSLAQRQLGCTQHQRPSKEALVPRYKLFQQRVNQPE